MEGAFLPQSSPGNQLSGGGAPFESLRSHPLPPHALSDWWRPASPRPSEAGRRRGSRPEVCRWGRVESCSVKGSVRRAEAGSPRARARAREILLGFSPAAWTSRRRARGRPNERGLRTLPHSHFRPLLLRRSELSFKAVKLMLRLGKFGFLGSLRSEAPCEPDPSVVIFPNLRKQLNAYILSILRFSKKCISTGFLGKNIRILSQSRCEENNGFFRQGDLGSDSTVAPLLTRILSTFDLSELIFDPSLI